jgi:hypothetical protein
MMMSIETLQKIAEANGGLNVEHSLSLIAEVRRLHAALDDSVSLASEVNRLRAALEQAQRTVERLENVAQANAVSA